MLIASGTASIFSDRKPPTLYEAYPELFGKELEEEKYKAFQAQMLQYAEMWNLQNQNKRQGGPDDGTSGS